MNEQIYLNILDNLYEGVYFINRKKRIIYWNKGAEQITGYNRTELIGQKCSENMIIHIDTNGNILCQDRCPLNKTLEKGSFYEGEAYLHHKNGYRIPVFVRINPIRNSEGEIIGGVEVFIDNNSNVAVQQKIYELQKLALLDPLTEIGNRRYGEIKLNEAFNAWERYKIPFGILYLDIDNFKTINDQNGHDIGDQILKMITRTLMKNLRPFDFLSRWGGEEFIAIIINIKEDELFNMANRLRMLVEKSNLFLKNKIVNATISIGVAIVNKKDTIESLIKRADSLLYVSKNSGRNKISADL